MTTTSTTDLTLSITRVFRASPERVFDAWADPAKLARWFGPNGFTTRTHQHDFRPGGLWIHTMVGPDGKEYPNRIVFREIERPRRIAYDHESAPHFRTTVEFEPVPEGTRMSFRMEFLDAEAMRAAMEHGAREGLAETTARLGALVEGFTIERTFKAAPERVWQMWTTREGLMRWWALSAKDMGYEFTVKELDVREGGGFAFGMVGNGHDLTNHGTYTVVRPHGELAWTWRFDIFLGPDDKPYDVPIRVKLEQAPGGGTRMTFTQGPLAKPEFTEGSRQGVLANFEKLAKALGE